MYGATPRRIREEEQMLINGYMRSQGLIPGINKPCEVMGNKINSIAPKYRSDLIREGIEFGPDFNYWSCYQ